MGLSSVVVSIIIAAFFMSFAIGANDAANALATSYGSKAARLIYLLILGAIFEFVGASSFSSQIAGTLADLLIPGLNLLPHKIQTTMMLGTSFASVSIIMTSSIFGIPISGTHTVVGAIIGASLATAGKDSVDWSHLLTVVLSWFVSPVVAGIISGLLFIILCILTLDPNSFK